jgi:hypothetical protein
LSPRSNRSRAARRRRGSSAQASGAGEEGELGPGAYSGPEQRVDWGGEDWVARRISGSASTKAYRCPGCDQEIRPATPHVVAWPAGVEGEASRLEDRRHWHTPCWDARDRRRPN